MKAEVDRLASSWEEVIGLPISKGDRDKFLREYIRIRGSEVFFLERIALIESDLYMHLRAKSINFLYGGFDIALKDKAEIIQAVTKALRRAQTTDELKAQLEEIPNFIRQKCRNFITVTDSLVQHLLKTPIEDAQRRLKITTIAPRKEPQNIKEIAVAIREKLASDTDEKTKERLAMILEILPRSSFAQCLTMFHRHSKSANEEATA